MNFQQFLQNRQKDENHHFYTENDNTEFEKEVFLHIGLGLALKK
jgi:hypothetical protein